MPSSSGSARALTASGMGVADWLVRLPSRRESHVKMKPHSTFLASALLASSLTLPAVAFAQTATNSDVEPAAQPITQPAPGETNVTEPSRAPGVETTAMPQSEMPQSDVVAHRWPNRPLLITGGIALVGAYGASAIVGAESNRKGDDRLFLPVVGPWFDLKDRDCGAKACSSDTFNKALLIGDGALQGIGAIAVLLSLVIPEPVKRPWYLVGDEKLSIAPQFGSTTTGLTAVGEF